MNHFYELEIWPADTGGQFVHLSYHRTIYGAMQAATHHAIENDIVLSALWDFDLGTGRWYRLFQDGRYQIEKRKMQD